MKNRIKYLTEFVLHVVGNRKILIPVEYLKELNEEGDYNIYSILAAPEIHLKRHTSSKNSINLEVFRIVDEEEELYNFDFTLADGLDHRKVGVKSIFPYNSIEFEIQDSSFIKSHKIDETNFTFEVGELFQLNSRELVSKLDYEVLYIGQSQGTNQNSDAFNRLSSHSTLQKILSDYQSTDKKIWVLLIELNTNINMIMDGTSKDVIIDEDVDNKHMQQVLCELPETKQVINITEAALIHYFKPHYNTNFVENFPDKKHRGYKQYYNLDYKALTVELGLHWDLLATIRLYTDHNSIGSLFQYVQYELHNDINRKSMYEIFKNK
jgi:hypothetical protein